MKSQRSAGFIITVMGFTISLAEGFVVAPYSGVPFEQNTGLDVSPGFAEDTGNTEMMVHRLLKSKATSEKEASAHVCDMGDQADETKCLGAEGRGCMWTRLETKDPYKRVQASNSYCLPCTLDDEEIPCWNPGAWLNGMQVTDCKMSCNHQQRIWQPEYACSDDTGFINQAQCFSRGSASGSKCMFIAYEDKEGVQKGSCAPCQLTGSGGWGCPAKDDAGPEDGSKVVGCLSQCDVLCTGPPACPPTIAPPPPPPPPSPGVLKVSSAADIMINAPAPFSMPTPNPQAVVQAIREAAQKAGWSVATTPPPKVYWPVIYYRQPLDYLFTTGPPPVDPGVAQATIDDRMFGLDPASAPELKEKRQQFLQMPRRRQ